MSVDTTIFNAPQTWKTYHFRHGTFSIQMPPSMKSEEDTLIKFDDYYSTWEFEYIDTSYIVDNYKLNRARITLTYYYEPYGPFGDTFRADELLSQEESYKMMNRIMFPSFKMKEKEKIYYGPFYRTHQLLSGRKHYYVYGSLYKRNIVGPEVVYYFRIMNKIESMLIVIIYDEDNDPNIIKDLQFIVKTFKWRRIY